MELDNSYDFIAVERMKKQVQDLKEQLKYPNITIRLEQMGYEISIVARLELPDDELIVARQVISTYCGKDVKLLDYIKERLIREISYKYMMRAFKHHLPEIKTGEV